ncbi:MAG TPA: PTS sugar transporter subunit IIC, partial [Negativicutes bacterium]|nr:PTS sugar transporter subunit IIC [Negativicutes bacterium]
VLNFMAQGLFSSLIIGLILKQLGVKLGIPVLAGFGSIAQLMMGPAIGAAVAYGVKAPVLSVFSSLITGALGAQTLLLTEAGTYAIKIGEPVGALCAALIGAEIGKLVNNKTKLNIIVVPAATIIAGGITSIFVSPFMSSLMTALGQMINYATELQPVPMGILVSTLMGMILTLPISSAALAIALKLDGLAAGAATIGCCAQMVGFAAASYRENKIGGLVAQGLGTSMLQVPNIIKNPLIWIPPTVASAVLGPVASAVFRMKNNAVGAGMGTSGLVGQFATIEVMGTSSLPLIFLLHFAAPAVITLIVSEYMRRKGWIKFGDMKLYV